VRERSGLESSLDVIEAERDLARARFHQADALVDAVLARYRVRVAAGERLSGVADTK
jgi:outer membrane protein TolC